MSRWSELLAVPMNPVFHLLLGAVAVYVAFHYGAEHLAPRLRKLVGGAVLALGSAALLWRDGADLLAVGLGWGETTSVLPATAVLAAILVPIVMNAARKPGMQETIEVVGPVAWTAYLCGYEYFFRGLLLLGLVPHVGPASALGISTALYVLQHLTKHAAETASTLLMGVVFGQLTLVSGSIWPAVMLHVAIATSSEFSVSRSPYNGGEEG